MMHAPGYTIRPLTEPATIRAFLNADRALTAYAVGDLDPALWPHSRFVGAYTGDRLAALALWFHGLDPVVLTLFGAPDGVRAILAASDNPAEVYYLCPPQLGDVLGQFYERPAEHREWRMVLAPQAFQAPQMSASTRLLPDDAPALAALYQHAASPGETVVAFSPQQIADGVFFGVWQGNALVATAGTHVWSPAERVVAIGNVFTHPNARGRGYATQCTAAVVRAALHAGIDTIILNVRCDNTPALRVYEKLGFSRYHLFLEGPGLRRTPAS